MLRQRIRSVNFTPQEVILLVEMVIQHKDIIECKQADSAMWKQKNDTWNNITNEFNNHNKNVQRDMKTLRLKYDCLKREVRNKLARNQKAQSEENKQPLLNYEEKLAKVLSIGTDQELDIPEVKIKTEDLKEQEKDSKDPLEIPNEKVPEDVDDIPLAERSTKNILNISKGIVSQNRCLAKAQIDVALKKKEYLTKKIEFMKEIHELTVKKLKLDIQEKQLSLLSNYCLEDY